MGQAPSRGELEWISTVCINSENLRNCDPTFTLVILMSDLLGWRLNRLCRGNAKSFMG